MKLTGVINSSEDVATITIKITPGMIYSSVSIPLFLISGLFVIANTIQLILNIFDKVPFNGKLLTPHIVLLFWYGIVMTAFYADRKCTNDLFEMITAD